MASGCVGRRLRECRRASGRRSAARRRVGTEKAAALTFMLLFCLVLFYKDLRGETGNNDISRDLWHDFR